MNHYFFIDETGKQRGTFSPVELRRENIKRETLVWTQGMENWKRADEVSELKFIFEQSGVEQISEPQPGIPVSPENVAFEKENRNLMPKTWLVESILVTILPFMFCGSFLSLLGIIAIVYSAQVESFYNRGDYTAALESSRSAGKWTKITFWIFIAWVLLLAVAMLLLFGLLGFSLTGMGDLIDL
ncbi:MAG: CD225/dispanin family protein [Fermentimonas sp.]|nr:CD225/dispanin family protein [Fermentimonas sp.]MDD4008927.1 CD225/dispanin family protein [Fermentimonas sp.]MDD4695965.1 CD225/dispanin family protein [Fermentimonas sp.]